MTRWRSTPGCLAMVASSFDAVTMGRSRWRGFAGTFDFPRPDAVRLPVDQFGETSSAAGKLVEEGTPYAPSGYRYRSRAVPLKNWLEGGFPVGLLDTVPQSVERSVGLPARRTTPRSLIHVSWQDGRTYYRSRGQPSQVCSISVW